MRTISRGKINSPLFLFDVVFRSVDDDLGKMIDIFPLVKKSSKAVRLLRPPLVSLSYAPNEVEVHVFTISPTISYNKSFFVWIITRLFFQYRASLQFSILPWLFGSFKNMWYKDVSLGCREKYKVYISGHRFSGFIHFICRVIDSADIYITAIFSRGHWHRTWSDAMQNYATVTGWPSSTCLFESFYWISRRKIYIILLYLRIYCQYVLPHD